MTTSEKGLALIKKYEGFFSKPYLDPIGIPTIGYGVIRYPDGKRVTMTDKPLSEKQASDMLAELLRKTYEPEVSKQVKSKLNQNQFDALVSFTYNLGGTNLSKSTLLQKVNTDPSDPSIRQEFPKWNKAGGKVLAGLTKRRLEEAELYFEKDPGKASVKKTSASLRLRKGAGTDFAIIATLEPGTEVNILSEKDGWSEVFVCPLKLHGWVSNNYIV